VQYEAELEQILKDTADKVNFFKSRLDEASDEKRVKEVARVSVFVCVFMCVWCVCVCACVCVCVCMCVCVCVWCLNTAKLL